MFAISTSDYREACGDRPRSPLATNEERIIFQKNEENLRLRVEEKLNEISSASRKNLIVYISRNPKSDYELQDIKILLLYRSQNAPSEFETISLRDRARIYPDVWKGFDFSCFLDKRKWY